jgi:serine/threonine protein kinase
MSALGVDTRSDIFSLGVLLYELLTGSTPLSHKRLKEAAYGEILRMIREEEAPKPSTRLSDSGEALASISANRHTEPGKLSKLMRGELDWIVLKTLEKDRNRRYETASGLAADVQRYLDDEPVQACPPTAGYRLRKFARRNKGLRGRHVSNRTWTSFHPLVRRKSVLVGKNIAKRPPQKRRPLSNRA